MLVFDGVSDSARSAGVGATTAVLTSCLTRGVAPDEERACRIGGVYLDDRNAMVTLSGLWGAIVTGLTFILGGSRRLHSMTEGWGSLGLTFIPWSGSRRLHSSDQGVLAGAGPKARV